MPLQLVIKSSPEATTISYVRTITARTPEGSRYHFEGAFLIGYTHTDKEGHLFFMLPKAGVYQVGDGENKVVIAVNDDGQYTRLVGEEIDNALVGYFEADTRWTDLEGFAIPGGR